MSTILKFPTRRRARLQFWCCPLFERPVLAHSKAAARRRFDLYWRCLTGGSRLPRPTAVYPMK